MSVWLFYLIGFAIALVWVTYDYYVFNAKLGKDMRYIFTDPNDIKHLFLFALGSWFAVIMLIFSDDD